MGLPPGWVASYADFLSSDPEGAQMVAQEARRIAAEMRRADLVRQRRQFRREAMQALPGNRAQRRAAYFGGQR